MSGLLFLCETRGFPFPALPVSVVSAWRSYPVCVCVCFILFYFVLVALISRHQIVKDFVTLFTSCHVRP